MGLKLIGNGRGKSEIQIELGGNPLQKNWHLNKNLNFPRYVISIFINKAIYYKTHTTENVEGKRNQRSSTVSHFGMPFSHIYINRICSEWQITKTALWPSFSTLWWYRIWHRMSSSHISKSFMFLMVTESRPSL